jgi:predicted deacylase
LSKKTISVGTVRARPGELARGSLRVGEMRNNTPIDIPVLVANGGEDGPVIYLESTVHGAEIAGIEVLRRVLRENVRPTKLRGAIIAIPAANPLAYEVASRTSPQDGGNLWAAYPGRADGSITQRIADMIWNEVVLQSQYALDIHCISYPGMHFNILMQKGETEDTNERELAMAQAYGVTVIGYGPTAVMWGIPGQLQTECLRVGIPCLTTELTDTRAITPQAVEPGVRGVMNVLKHLKMVDGEPEAHRDTVVLDPKHVHYFENSLRATRSGMMHIVKNPGELASKGEPIAELYDLLGDRVEVVKMPFPGYVATYPAHSWVGYQAVGTGDFIADVFHS